MSALRDKDLWIFLNGTRRHWIPTLCSPHNLRIVRLLALDTATEACSVALWCDGEVLARFEHAGRTHTQRLAPMVDEVLAEAGCTAAQLDGLVCGTGPGSFAGVRIAVGFVKGLALALDRPVVGVSSLAMLAQGAIEAGGKRVLSAIDARMDEVYFGAFEVDENGLARALAPAMVTAPAQVRVDIPGPWQATGSGWGRYAELLRAGVGAAIESVDGLALPHAAAGLKLALPEFLAGRADPADALSPAYLRDKVALTLDEQQHLRAGKSAAR
ncbi:tRNA (adenosine(37)-N6)-threonylcarbamoyltransferase complex dimerization subunit type 1 TsaB [Panacagrimonas sp.]|uniref:tRNA (adenosine(37)-N6)-threonylcarbamoyltransferase complex dimerization subunit type 1 TsaB n=1 Tax=Panacagrimonas sp. TaxID=2480088 RepID=UPI003B5189E1